MLKGKIKEKGIVLFIVLATIFIVILLGNIILTIISSQARLTHHNVSRIQAYYAAMAGVNYAYDKLRSGNDTTNWSIASAGNSYEHKLCRGCIAPDIDEPALPIPIQDVVIRVAGIGASLPNGGTCTPPGNVPACISATANYTYTP